MARTQLHERSNDTGLIFLENLNQARRLNRWIYDYIEPYLGHSVLEVGCGIGNITELLLSDSTRRVTALDIDPHRVEYVRRKFDRAGLITLECDITSSRDVAKLAAGGYDTVVCLNVLEHIENDDAALAAFHHLLAPGGKLILLNPAHRFLYGKMDKHLGHFRRYTRAGLAAQLERQRFKVVRGFHFNSFSTIGWFLNGRVFNARHASPLQIKVVEAIVPTLRFFEDRIKLPFGLSVLMIAEK